MSDSKKEIGLAEVFIAVSLFIFIIFGVTWMRGCEYDRIKAIPPVVNSQGQTTIHIPAGDYNDWLVNNKDKKVISAVPISDGLLHGRTSELIVTYEIVKHRAEKNE